MADTSKKKDILDDLLRSFKRQYSYTTQTLFSDKGVFIDPDHEEKEGNIGFDSYHYDYYHTRLNEPTIQNARDQMVWNHFCMKLAKGGVKTLYVPTAITGGILADQLAIESDHRLPVVIGKQKLFLRNSHDLDKSSAGGERVYKDVVEPNEREAMGRLTYLGKSFPEYALLYPFDKEGAVHQNRSDSDSSFNRAPEQEDFMGGWYTEIDDDLCEGIIYERDIPFSRNSNWEAMRGTANAVGVFDGVTRENADFKFFRSDRRYCTMAERIQSTTEYLVFALANDFYAQEAATSLAWMLEIDKRLSNKDYNESSVQPIDVENIADQLKQEYESNEEWADEARYKTSVVKPFAEKLLLRYFVGHIKEDHMDVLSQEYHEARENLPEIEVEDTEYLKGYYKPKKKSLDQKLRSLGISPQGKLVSAMKARVSNMEDYRKIRSSSDDDKLVGLRKIATPRFRGEASDLRDNGAHQKNTVRQISHEEDIFDPDNSGSRYFDRHYFTRIKSKREQIAVRMAIGAMMTITPPYNRPGWVFVSSDLKKGHFGELAADKYKVSDIEELEAAIADPEVLKDEVIIPSVEKCLEVAQQESDDQKKMNGFAGPILSSVDIDYKLAKAYEELPFITAIDGPPGQKLSSEAKMAIRIAIIDFMTDTLRLADNKWANSEKQVNHVARATLCQLGLVERGYMHPFNMVITDPDGKELDLYDRLEPIASRISYCVENGLKSPEHALAALMFTQLHEMLADPQYNTDRNGHKVIEFNNIHESFANYRYGDTRESMDRLIYGDENGKTDLEKNGLRAYLIENCSDWLDYKDVVNDLDPDIYRAWTELTGDKDVKFSNDPMDTRLGLRAPPKPY